MDKPVKLASPSIRDSYRARIDLTGTRVRVPWFDWLTGLRRPITSARVLWLYPVYPYQAEVYVCTYLQGLSTGDRRTAIAAR